MATAGLILLLIVAGFALMACGGAFALSGVRRGVYPGLGAHPNDAVGVCQIIDRLSRQEQLRTTLAGVITMTDAEVEEMARIIEERHSSQMAARSVPVRQPAPVTSPLRRMIFGRQRNLDLGA